MPLHRNSANPILTRTDIPQLRPHLVDVSSVFNPGAVMISGRTLLLLRVQNRGRETFLMAAMSADGVHFVVTPHAVEIRGLERFGRVYHVYDPRLTWIEERLYATLSLDMDRGSRVAVARVSDDLCEQDAPTSSPNLCENLEALGLTSGNDSRNGVLFPERIGGRYLLLERPNQAPSAGGEPASGDIITLSASDDLVRWEPAGEVCRGRWRFWDERIGPGTPPVKTREGWLLLYHGVATHFGSSNLYQAGALLLDLEDPTRVLARTRYNLLEPRESYEITGQVPNVVFPTGWTVEGHDREDGDAAGFAPLDSLVRVYYGAADTCVGLATTTIGELLSDCREGDI